VHGASYIKPMKPINVTQEENVRRKHNFVPFIFNLLKELSQAGKLDEVVKEAQKKAESRMEAAAKAKAKAAAKDK